MLPDIFFHALTICLILRGDYSWYLSHLQQYLSTVTFDTRRIQDNAKHITMTLPGQIAVQLFLLKKHQGYQTILLGLHRGHELIKVHHR